MPVKHLFLTGYRGTGKSTIGRLVATSLAYPFVDTDAQIELWTGKTIAEIFEELGEQTFRDFESEQLAQMAKSAFPYVVSLGGGVIIRDENRRLLAQLGLTVWLQASPEVIVARIANDPMTQSRRPKLSTLSDLEEVRSKLADRWAWYSEVASMTIDVDGRTPDEIARAIVVWYLQTE